MHIPAKWQMDSIEHMHQLIENYGFATLVSSNLNASLIPLLLETSVGDKGTLFGHLSKANTHWQEIDGQRVLAIFNGPHAYISPTWYASKPAVPTWNYATVHVYGKVELTEPLITIDILNKTIQKYEPSLMQRSDVLDEAYRDKLLKGIVGFKIIIDDIQGKEKLGQHRSIEDQEGVLKGLSTRKENSDALQLFDYMMEKRGLPSK